jgi:endonuclease/exonuclease/phosphatase family metal-dependent hydrolase
MKHRSTHTAIRWILALLILGTAGFGFAKDSPKSKEKKSAPRALPDFYVANWNVENLFDTKDDPKNKYDNEFLPGNVTTRWTRVRLDTKLNNLSRVIRSMNHGKGPDILGLQEVEHEHLVKKLADKLGKKSYGVAHKESRDRRGIDAALIYNKKLFTLIQTDSYKVSLRYGSKTRDILHVELKDRNGGNLHVMVNHWPSRGGGIELSDPKRFAAARTLSKAITRIFKEDKKAHVIVLGDFNDEPSSKSVSGILKVNPYPSKSGYAPKKLYNLTSKKSAKGQGTYFHSFRGRISWRMYDQIIVSGTLLNNATIDYDKGSMEIAGPSFMLSTKGRSKGAPYSTFVGRGHYLGGYSDHMPVGARFTYPGSPKSAKKSDAKAKKAKKGKKQPKKSKKSPKNDKPADKPAPEVKSDESSPAKEVVYF